MYCMIGDRDGKYVYEEFETDFICAPTVIYEAKKKYGNNITLIVRDKPFNLMDVIAHE